MHKRNNISLTIFLSLFGFIFVGLPFISSCGKSGTVGPSSNIQYQILNLSPNLGSVDLYINFLKVNSSSFFYPSSSGYFVLSKIDTPFQIRPGTSLVQGTVVPSFNMFSLKTILKPNSRYTLFIAGPALSDSILLTNDDTAATPTTGRGKIRFVNASQNSVGLDVTANGTAAFTNQKFLIPSDYVEFPAGIYDFQIFPAGTTGTLLKDYQNVTIQDGRLYTLYTYGVAGQADSLAFGAGFIANGTGVIPKK